MFILLDQTKACYDAPDIFNGIFKTKSDLKKELQFYDKNADYQVTVLDTDQPINNGELGYKEYTYKEIIKLLESEA